MLVDTKASPVLFILLVCFYNSGYAVWLFLLWLFLLRVGKIVHLDTDNAVVDVNAFFSLFVLPAVGAFHPFADN